MPCGRSPGFGLGGDSDSFVVDSTGATIADYVLEEAAGVCVPMPAELRANIADIVLTAMTGDGWMSVLSTRVRITPDGVIVCGNLSSLAPDVAVGKVGSPPEIEDPEIATLDPGIPPDTGATSPGRPWAFAFLTAGLFIVAIGLRTTSLMVSRVRSKGMRR